MKKIFIILLLLISCCGCSSDKKELRKTAFPISLYLTYDEQLKEFEIAILVINFSSLSKIELESGSTSDNTNIYTSKGSSFIDAFSKLNVESKDNISTTYVKSIVIHNSLIENDLLMYIVDGFFKSPKYRATIWLYVTNLTTKEVFNVSPTLDSSPYFNLINAPQKSEQFKIFKPMTISEILVRLSNGNKMIAIPNIYIEEENNFSDNNGESKPLRTYDVDGYYFNLIGTNTLKYIKKELLEGYQWIDIKEPIKYEVFEKDDGFVCQFLKSKVKIKDNIMHVKLSCSVRTNLGNVDLDEIKKTIEKIATNQLYELLNLSNEERIDFFFLEKYNYDIKNMETLQIEVNSHIDAKINF